MILGRREFSRMITTLFPVREMFSPVGKMFSAAVIGLTREERSFSFAGVNCTRSSGNHSLNRIRSRARSMGRAITALSPTSTIGRFRSPGFSTIAAITSPSGVFLVSPSSLNRGSFVRTNSNAETPSFLSSLLISTAVSGSMK